MNPFIKIVLISFSVFFLSWFVVYKTGINELSIQSEDTLPAMFLPVSMIKDKTLYADKYYEMIREKYPHPDDKDFAKDLTPFYFKKVGTHYISAFTLMAGILAVPVYLIPLLLGVPVTFENVTILAHIASSLILAFSGGFFYLLLKNHLHLEQKKSMLLTSIYLFATVNYAMISQALWQHGPVQFFAILALIFLYKKNWFMTSFMLGWALLSRPTAGILFPFFYFLLVHKEISGNYTLQEIFKTPLLKNSAPTKIAKKTVLFVLGTLPALAFFLWYNSTYFQSIQNQGYFDQMFVNWLSPLWEGFLGIWFSPSKGILVYSPIFLFSFWGVYSAASQNKDKATYFTFLLITVTHIMIYAKWKHWFGGYSYGYRMASDIIPFLVLLIVPYVQSEFFEKTKPLFYILISISVLIEILGIVFFDGIWHGLYDTGYKNTSWLWSLKDSEFAFNMRRVFQKLEIRTN